MLSRFGHGKVSGLDQEVGATQLPSSDGGPDAFAADAVTSGCRLGRGELQAETAVEPPQSAFLDPRFAVPARRDYGDTGRGFANSCWNWK